NLNLHSTSFNEPTNIFGSSGSATITDSINSSTTFNLGSGSTTIHLSGGGAIINIGSGDANIDRTAGFGTTNISIGSGSTGLTTVDLSNSQAFLNVSITDATALNSGDEFVASSRGANLNLSDPNHTIDLSSIHLVNTWQLSITGIVSVDNSNLTNITSISAGN